MSHNTIKKASISSVVFNVSENPNESDFSVPSIANKNMPETHLLLK